KMGRFNYSSTAATRHVADLLRAWTLIRTERFARRLVLVHQRLKHHRVVRARGERAAGVVDLLLALPSTSTYLALLQLRFRRLDLQPHRLARIARIHVGRFGCRIRGRAVVGWDERHH